MSFKFLTFLVLTIFSVHGTLPFLKQKAENAQTAMCISQPKAAEPICETYKEVLLNTENASHCSVLMDVLYWKPAVSDWIIGYSGVEENSQESSIIHNEIDWGPGGRLSLNFSGVYDWTIGFIGTYYHNHKSIHETKSLHNLGIQSTDIVSSNNATYLTFDLNFSSKLILNKTLSISPMIGARAVSIKERALYHLIGTSNDEPRNLLLKIPVIFIGYGPQFGLLGFFKLGDTNLDFFGSLATSLAYGKNSSHININEAGQEGSFTLHNHFYHLKASLQLVSGMQYKYHFNDSNFSLGFHLDYEANLWWDINNRLEMQEKSFSVSNLGANFTLHGGNFGILFDF